MSSRTEPFRPEAPIVAEIAAGAVLLDESGTETLLLHQRNEDRWCLPKGHVDPGESLAVAALREIREETGLIDLQLGPEVAEVTYRFYRPEKRCNVHKTSVYFVAHTPKQPSRPERIFDRAEWVDLETARARLKYDTDRAVIDAVVKARAAEDGSRANR